MRHLSSKIYLNRSKAHRKALLANLTFALIERKRIETTLAKAKALRSFAERIITKAKENTIHAKRIVFSKVHNKYFVKYLFEEIAPKYIGRNGGYTRIIKLGNRKGDAAPMAIVELVGFEEEVLKAAEERVSTKEKIKKEEKKPEMARSKVDKLALENTSPIEKLMKTRWKAGKWHPGAKKAKKTSSKEK
ncbi:MAG: 50S ribosomal protein L17 [bacterium]|nr:50S ribosomal protein L17 [bacterium]